MNGLNICRLRFWGLDCVINLKFAQMIFMCAKERVRLASSLNTINANYLLIWQLSQTALGCIFAIFPLLIFIRI